MANETGTVELPPETTEPVVAETQDAVFKKLFGEQSEDPQKSVEAPTPTEEPQPSTETTPQVEPDTPPTAEPTEEETEDGLPPDVQDSVNKRIAKVVAKRKELEEQLATKEAEMAELEAKVKELSEAKEEAPPPQVAPELDPVLRNPEIKKLWEQEQSAHGALQKASELLRLSRRSPDAVLATLKQDHKKEFVDIDEARDFLEIVKENASLMRQELAGKRSLATQRHVQKIEQEAQKHHDTAVKAYPWLPKKDSSEGKVAQSILKRFPALLDPLSVPDGMVILGDLVAGQMAREARAKAPAAPAAPPPKLPTPGKAPTATRPTGRPPANALKEKALDSGDILDAAKYLEKSPVFS